MTEKLNFQQMSRKKLRAYVLKHRENNEALRIYMDRMHNEPGVSRKTGGLNDEDFNQLEQTIMERVKDI